MNLLYVSNHRFIKKNNGEVFTTGQMGIAYFDRFRNFFDKVTVIGLCEDENKTNTRKAVEKVDTNSNFVRYEFIKTSGSPIGILLSLRKIIRQIFELIPNHDRMATKAPSLIANAAVRIAKKNNIPILVEMVGCPWDAYWNHSMKGKFIALPIFLLTRNLVKRAQYVVYVSNSFLQRRYPTKGKKLGCSDVSLPPLDDDILELRLNKINQMSNKEPIVLGTVAAVSVKYKGQEYVIKAIAKLNEEGYNYEYHLAGGGDNSYLMNIAEELKVADKVKFLGPIPHESVFEFMKNIDIYIQPSNAESFARSILEAMSTACPVIGSSTGGIPELISKEFVFKRKDVHDLMTKIKRMTKTKMTLEAQRNFERAKEFDKAKLDRKRNEFYMRFKNGL